MHRVIQALFLIIFILIAGFALNLTYDYLTIGYGVTPYIGGPIALIAVVMAIWSICEIYYD